MRSNIDNNDNRQTTIKAPSKKSPTTAFGAYLSGLFGCISRTTIRYFRNLPNRIRNYFRRKYNEYKRRPPRKDINKVYVLVGYTTKKHADSGYLAERFMIRMRRGMLVIIFILILIISFNWVYSRLDFEQYKKMFGIEKADELTQSDPFAIEGNSDSEGLGVVTATPIPSQSVASDSVVSEN